MAFTIKIYEKREYVYSLLKKRLISFFPDAYIINPYFDEQDHLDRFSSFTRVLYNPDDIDQEDVSSEKSSPIRLTEDGGIINCSRLVRQLRSESINGTEKVPVTGSMYAVLPFVYTSARDGFIEELSSRLSEADYNIRLDFTSKLRALWRGSSGCNMTALLEACRSRKFVPEDILKYCSMDESGFLTPGYTKGFDDVYDIGIERSKVLMNHAADLVHHNMRFINTVAVIEGFRTSDLPELLCSCDKVFILLPSERLENGYGANELISLLTRNFGKERISVYYADDLPDENPDNGKNNRRMVV